MPGKKKPGPSVKDDEVYESVRDGGRIQGEGRPDRQRQCEQQPEVSRSAGGPIRLVRRLDGRQALRKRAKELGLSGYSGKKKSELVAMLRDH